MPVIPISSDDPKLEERIAADVAARLGYKILGRELLTVVAQKHNIEEKKLVRALDEPLRFVGLSLRLRRELINYVQAECLERLLADDIVCRGLAAHLYMGGVSHALRVRILADPKERISNLGLQVDGRKKGETDKILKSLDLKRKRWSLELFGIDETDPSCYDMVLSVATMSPEKVVDIICDTSKDRKFQAMTYSTKNLQDKVLVSRVLEQLIHQFPDAQVQANGGKVTARVPSMKRERTKTRQTVLDLVQPVSGIRYVDVQTVGIFGGRAFWGDR
jgi:cytidylate kinase